MFRDSENQPPERFTGTVIIPDISGIYYIKNIKDAPRHDRYNGPIEVKIPDPTINLACLGE